MIFIAPVTDFADSLNIFWNTIIDLNFTTFLVEECVVKSKTITEWQRARKNNLPLRDNILIRLGRGKKGSRGGGSSGSPRSRNNIVHNGHHRHNLTTTRLATTVQHYYKPIDSAAANPASVLIRVKNAAKYQSRKLEDKKFNLLIMNSKRRTI